MKYDNNMVLKRINAISKNHYSLYCAYGRQQLVMDVEGGGVSDISQSMTGPEMFRLLCALEEYVIREA